ncbi:MAG: hypothetical protein AAFN65_05085 [Bacteroidota bacterium]
MRNFIYLTLLSLISTAVLTAQEEASQPPTILYIDGGESRIGFFASDRFIYGGRVDLMDLERDEFVLGAFARYYFTSSAKRLRPYLQADIGTVLFTDWQLRAGLELGLAPNLAINNEYGYRRPFGSNDDPTPSWQLRGYLSGISSPDNTDHAFRAGDLLLGGLLYEFESRVFESDDISSTQLRIRPHLLYALFPKIFIEARVDMDFIWADFLAISDEKELYRQINIYGGFRYLLTTQTKVRPYAWAGIELNTDVSDRDFFNPTTGMFEPIDESYTIPQGGIGALIPTGTGAFLDVNLGVIRPINPWIEEVVEKDFDIILDFSWKFRL